eukprot:4221575-Pleurochrysis_carterae.AAC.1
MLAWPPAPACSLMYAPVRWPAGFVPYPMQARLLLSCRIAPRLLFLKLPLNMFVACSSTPCLCV